MDARLNKIAKFPEDFRYYERHIPPEFEQIVQALGVDPKLKIPKHHWILERKEGEISVISHEFSPDSTEPIYEMWDKSLSAPAKKITAAAINEYLASNNIPPYDPAQTWAQFSLN